MRRLFLTSIALQLSIGSLLVAQDRTVKVIPLSEDKKTLKDPINKIPRVAAWLRVLFFVDGTDGTAKDSGDLKYFKLFW